MSDGEDETLDGAIPPAENTNLFGHAEAQTFLAQAYRSGKSHHAVLIEGPEGIGKATLAFRYANHVLANPDAQHAPDQLSPPDPDTLGYRQIVAGSSHNLLHLTRPFDEKTGRQKTAITVEEVRKAGKFFAQTSGSDSWRIVIVDTADELNRNAANAILKILEEPPRKAMFLVLSHSPGKLLPTIRSRCLTLKLRPLADAEMEAALNALGFELAPETRGELLRHANGSVAEALKLVNYGGLEILGAFEAILSNTGGEQRREMIRLSDALSARGADTIFNFFISNLFRRISQDARAAAMRGEIAAAEELARLSRDLRERVETSVAYNLDRKQTVLEAVDAYVTTAR